MKMVEMRNEYLNYINNKGVNPLAKKHEYLKNIYEKHKILFEYKDLIAETDVESLTISKDDIIATTLQGEKYYIVNDGSSFNFPLSLLNFGNCEKRETELLLKIIKEGSTVFDIGANIGHISITLATQINNLNIYSFEPIYKTYETLKKNILLNNINNIKTFNLGFSDIEAEVPFYVPEDKGNASMINVAGNADAEKMICNVKKLDDFVSENEEINVDFIKCDVEGAELLVIKGGIKTINRCKPIIMIEMLRKWSAKYNYHPNDIINILFEMGYKCYTINSQGCVVEFFSMDENTIETNFFFFHKEKHENIISKIFV